MSAVREALCKFLQEDTGAGRLMELATDVYPGTTAPEGAAFPFVVVFAQQARRGEFVFGGLDREESRYVVKAVDADTSPARVGEMNRRIRARLDPDGRGEVELDIDGHGTLFLGWVQDVEFDEPDGDTVYQHEGGIYEVWTEPE